MSDQDKDFLNNEASPVEAAKGMGSNEGSAKKKKKNHPIIKGLLLIALLVSGTVSCMGYLLGADEKVQQICERLIKAPGNNDVGKDGEATEAAIVIKEEAAEEEAAAEEAAAGDAAAGDAAAGEAAEEMAAEEAAAEEAPEEGATSGYAPGIHKYDSVLADVTWHEAYEDAKNQTKDGMKGHLLTIETQEEWDFISDNLNKDDPPIIEFYIGAKRNDDSRNFYWIGPEESGYGVALNGPTSWIDTEWYPGEPSYEGVVDGKSFQENRLELMFIKEKDNWYINDVPEDIASVAPANKGKRGYIIEYEP